MSFHDQDDEISLFAIIGGYALVIGVVLMLVGLLVSMAEKITIFIK